jgi:hypothetical protein
MDERVFASAVGKPVPVWDLRHRLPIDRPVGPELQDAGTIFRINSTFMDVTDQPYMSRQTLGAIAFSIGVMALLSAGGVAALWATSALLPDGFTLTVMAIIGAFMYFFGRVALKFGRDEFIALKRRPIRFNRSRQTIYAVRRRRFFAKAGEGDEIWEAPWNSESIFCVHKNMQQGFPTYYIRHYTVDHDGNVLRAFCIGREWQGSETLPGLLSQWNYWCEFMNHGPGKLPKPALFFSERENAEETFLFCLYRMVPVGGIVTRILLMPFIAFFTVFRLLAMWTSRDPVWSKVVEEASAVVPGTYDEPSGNTPVGWGATAVARESGTWPREEKRVFPLWGGASDAVKNAELWSEMSAPSIPLPGVR